MKMRWAPAIVLMIGCVLSLGVARQRSLPLEQPLAGAIPLEIHGYVGRDVLISDAEARVAGFSDYLFRTYEAEVPRPDSFNVIPGQAHSGGEGREDLEAVPWFTLYVGYYESQTRGNTIHSPKNCLPGAGWEALSSQPQELDLSGRSVTVNRYLLQNEEERALVLYWYQGRGRIASNEYRVKIDLLRDAALARRSDEALVRIVVPVTTAGEEAAEDIALRVADVVAPSLEFALPPG
jgi:EpsI family protein